MTMYSPASISQLEVEQSVDQFNATTFPAGLWLDAHAEFHSGGDFTILFTRDTDHGPRAFHAIYNDLGAIDELLSKFDAAEVLDGTLEHLIEELEAEYNKALVVGHGDWMHGIIILEREALELAAKLEKLPSKHKLLNGTRVKATLGETTIVGTIQNGDKSFYACNDVVVDGTPQIGHHDQITCWDESGWAFEVLPAVAQ